MRNILLIFLALNFIGCEEIYDVPNHVPSIVKIVDGNLYVAYGEGGLVISDLATRSIVAQIFPPRSMNSIDDFDVDGDLIFVLDTRGKDFIAAYQFSGNGVDLVTPPIAVEGGPFNGISASNGNLVVSGGTFFLERFRYSAEGNINGSVSFGRDRGHPDIQLSDDGNYAFVSTDFSLEADIRFGVLSLSLGNELSIPTVVSELGIENSGFSNGVTTPVGFPIQAAQLNDHLLVAHGGGLSIIQLTQGVFGSSQNIDIGINCTAISVFENIAYVVGLDSGAPTLVQVDLSDIDNPIIISTEKLAASNIPTSVAIGETEIYVAVGNDGLLILAK